MSCPTLYETPIDGMQIVRVDLLECLREVLGDNCMIYRDMCYKLVSGSCSTQKEHIDIFASAYRRFSSFTQYVNELYYYGEMEIPIIPRVLNPIREKIDAYCNEVMDTNLEAGGKYLMHTHDYLYFAYKGGGSSPTKRGIKVIC